MSRVFYGVYPTSVAGLVPSQGDSIPAIIGGYRKPPYTSFLSGKRVPGRGIPFLPLTAILSLIGGYGKPPYEIHLVGQDSIPAIIGGYGKPPYTSFLSGKRVPGRGIPFLPLTAILGLIGGYGNPPCEIRSQNIISSSYQRLWKAALYFGAGLEQQSHIRARIIGAEGSCLCQEGAQLLCQL